MRRLNPEERALWAKVIASVRPLHGGIPAAEESRPPPDPERKPAPAPPAKSSAPRAGAARPGTTLDGTWDRRISRGVIQPDLVVDLHGHSQAGAHSLLDLKLEQAIAMGARVLLLITGKPPAGDRSGRGAIRAAVGDWLAVSRHSRNIAAVRQAHIRHGGSGALYIVLRRHPNS